MTLGNLTGAEGDLVAKMVERAELVETELAALAAERAAGVAPG